MKGGNTRGRGSIGFGLFGLASQGKIVAVGLVVGGVVIGPKEEPQTQTEMGSEKKSIGEGV